MAAARLERGVELGSASVCFSRSSGAEVRLFTHLVVREDAHLLYGFATEGERQVFRQLIKISGVGPRTALSVLSGLSVNDLAQAVSTQETGRIVKVPGIGKKTAERLLLELKGKLGVDLGLPAGGVARSDAAQGERMLILIDIERLMLSADMALAG